MSDPFLAEIDIFPFNFAPRGWAFCSGQILPISQNTALFSLLGTTYGGNGTSNFALPDLRGRAPMGQGSGPGLTPRVLGETGGENTHTLLSTEMPAHSHPLQAFEGRGGSGTQVPVAGAALTSTSGGSLYGTPAANSMAPTVISQVGGNTPHNNLMPYLGLNFCIALQGIFPARN
ncbi:MAG TPA: tail fiber protein [Solirubrobacteraceae bacterium]|jgi:microcystin-dependent protein|nr:tail fiber protein [Solirubrobacteraceae bacterium]